MYTRNGSVIWVVTAATLCMALPGFAHGQDGERTGELIDRVIAVVEDRAVLQSELELEYRRILMQSQRTSVPDEEADAMRREILDGLVADLLMTVHAERNGIVVPEEQVDAAVERTIEESRRAIGGDAAFERQLETEGMTLEQLRSLYREKIRARMMNDQLLRQEIMAEVTITEAEIRGYYRDHIDELPKRPEAVNLAQILITPEPSEDRKEGALARIERIAARIAAGEDFAAVAREVSEDPSAKYGGSLGYLRLEDLGEPAFEAAVRELIVGGVSGPILTRFGYHLAKLEDISGEEVLVRHILITVESGEQDVARAAELAEQVRQELIDGADFAAMAAKYSADEKSKYQGGEVGEMALQNLPEYLRDVLQELDVGDIAPVVKDPKGFRVIKLLGRADERIFTFEEARDELKKFMEQEKMQEQFSDYVDSLRDIYYVEVKGDM